MRAPDTGPPPRHPRPLQFGLGSLLLFLGISTIFLKLAVGFGQGIGVAAFGIAMFGGLLLIYELIRISAPSMVVLIQTGSNAEAHVIRDYLCEHGIEAGVLEDVQAYSGLTPGGPQVLVPSEQLEKARELLRDRMDPDATL